MQAAKFIARKPIILNWIITDMSFALPVEKLCETSSLLAFYHPTPAYRIHILLVPKKLVPSLLEFDAMAENQFLLDLYASVKKLVEQFHLAEQGYRLVVNGGKYQDFPGLHFHLIAECGKASFTNITHRGIT